MVMTEQQNMMRRLQIQSFVLDDVRLYLDTLLVHKLVLCTGIFLSVRSQVQGTGY